MISFNLIIQNSSSRNMQEIKILYHSKVIIIVLDLHFSLTQLLYFSTIDCRLKLYLLKKTKLNRARSQQLIINQVIMTSMLMMKKMRCIKVQYFNRLKILNMQWELILYKREIPIMMYTKNMMKTLKKKYLER